MRAARNETPYRLPLYEHIIAPEKMEEIVGKKFADLINGDASERAEFFRIYCAFFRDMGYDTVSFERLITDALPGPGALYYHTPGVIETRSDFEAYPWDDIPRQFMDDNRKYYQSLREAMPEGMKGIGGAGNGVFECVQDVVGFENLCYIASDDPELYTDLFRKAGEVCLKIWEQVIAEFGDVFCVFRFGDDLGFRESTLLHPDDIRRLIFPVYKNIVNCVHQAGKPFLLHSCGCIFALMDDLIDWVGIDAKHSNEDQIARFPVWVERYGDRIGNFGGIDTDAVCHLSYPEMKEYITEVVTKCQGHGGFAFGSGNSIPDYVPAEGYLNMVKIVRELRGDF